MITSVFEPEAATGWSDQDRQKERQKKKEEERGGRPGEDRDRGCLPRRSGW